MAASTTPKLLAVYAARGLQRKLNLEPTQVRVDDHKYFDPAWHSFPLVQIVPGRADPERGGTGGQSGGVLLRRQRFALHVYCRSQLDPYDSTEDLLTRDNDGVLDFVERVRAVFEYTFFGDTASGVFLLFEPFRWDGEDDPELVDPEQKIVRKTIRYSGAYRTAQPNVTTLTLADVL